MRCFSVTADRLGVCVHAHSLGVAQLERERGLSDLRWWGLQQVLASMGLQGQARIVIARIARDSIAAANPLLHEGDQVPPAHHPPHPAAAQRLPR
eukprot:795454-Rhodomonas_salina.2